jgi:hypothetical protein
MKTIKMNSVKPAIFLIVVFVTISCSDLKNSGYYVSFTAPVEITNVSIPDTVTNMTQTHIMAHAEAFSGCWKYIYFSLDKSDNFEYTLHAFGAYESYGSCSAVMVTRDTSILFQPTQTGLYKFYIIKGEFETVIDTMIVK